MYLPLDGPSKQDLIPVTTSASVEVKAKTTVFDDRKVVTLQPLSFMIKIYFADEGEVPSAATVISKGFEHPKKAIRSYEACGKQSMYMISIGGNTNVVVAERG